MLRHAKCFLRYFSSQIAKTRDLYVFQRFSSTPAFLLGDRVATLHGELGRIDTIFQSVLRIVLDSELIIWSAVSEVTLLTASPFNSPRIDWRLIKPN